MTRRRVAFIGVVVLQVAVLGLIVAREELNLAFGTRLELEVVARDPLDPLTGAYQDFELSIERLPRSLGPPRREDAPETGDPVFVTLRSDANGTVPTGYSSLEPSPESTLYLRGRVRRVGETEIEVDYGLDRYYVPIDAADPTVGARPKLRLVVFVTAGGRATIEDLLVDGVPFDEWNRRNR